MSVKCTTCDKSCSFRKEPFNSDYAALLARYDALKEAVAWERECEELHGIITELYCNVSESAPEEDEISRTFFAASAEVDRLLQEANQ